MDHDEDGERLVTNARAAIVHELGGPALERPRGLFFDQLAATFVTVTRRGWLHGCIGSIVPRRSLIEDVEGNAVAAAFLDPRSPPFRADWLPDMGLEVTLLSPLARLTFTDEADVLRQVVPGVDGLVLCFGPYRGTFLPQVWESLPAPKEFLDELKVKAGLARSFWDGGLEIQRFRVQKWGDRGAPAAAQIQPAHAHA
jgi:AmmeMemoRadiSam system protein A